METELLEAPKKTNKYSIFLPWIFHGEALTS